MTPKTLLPLVPCAAFLTLSSVAFAEIVTLGPPPPKTKLEAFELQEGVTIMHGRSVMGAVRGLHGGRVLVIAREMTDMATGKKLYGVTITVTESAVGDKGRAAGSRDHTSHIDYDELPGLIRGLEQLGRLNRTSTRLDSFGGEYRTSGYFAVSLRGIGNDVSVSVSSGLSEPVTSSFQITDLTKLRDLLVNSVTTLDAIKEPPR